MEKKVVRNTLFLTSANLLARAIGFLSFIFLGRILGVTAFGHYNFALALVYNFYPVADFGIERVILRDLAKDSARAQEYFQKLLPLRFLMAFASLILAIVLGFVLGKNGIDSLNVFIFGFCLFSWNITQLVAGIGNAFEKMEIQSFLAVLLSVLKMIFEIFIAFYWRNVSLVLVGDVIGSILVLLVALRLSQKINLKFKIEVDLRFWKKVLSESWVFASIMILAVIYLRSSVMMVNYIKGAYFTGLYSSAFKFVEASILIPQSFALALFPQTARLLVSDKKKLLGNYFNSLAIIFGFSIIYALFFYFFSPLIIKIAYGPDYLGAVPGMKILAFASIFFFLNVLPGNVIQNSTKVKNFLVYALLNLVLVFIFGIMLIPRYSIEGAAWAVLLAEILGFVINNAFVWKILRESD
ncbi:MAG: Polysaccharide biosynthesis protein [Microgenomates group bacterium ADurb.Bin219]|nr:MAG: Polysaccharide biosynthesis protein [Microgenomates group bacterium ADurb.Bin219]